VCSVSLSFFLLYRVWYSFIASFATPFVSRASLNALIAFSPLIFLTSCLFSSTCHSLSLPLSLSLSLPFSLSLLYLYLVYSYFLLFTLSFPSPSIARYPNHALPAYSSQSSLDLNAERESYFPFYRYYWRRWCARALPSPLSITTRGFTKGFVPSTDLTDTRGRKREREGEREREREKVHYSFLPAIIRPFICKLDKNRRHLIEMYLTWVEKSIRIRLSAI